MNPYIIYSTQIIWYLLCLAHDFGYIYENYSQVYIELPVKRSFNLNYKTNRVNKFYTRKRWYEEHGIDITYLHPSFGVRSNIAYYNRNATVNLQSATIMVQ